MFWHLSKQSFRGCFSSPVLYTHICTHTQTPALKSAVIVSELETHPAFDLNFPALQEAGILTPHCDSQAQQEENKTPFLATT